MLARLTTQPAVKFHNSAGHVYGALMIHASSSPLLARLRHSPRFFVLMLLVFVLRIGADVACTAHDILDATAQSAGISLNPDLSQNAPGDPLESPFDVSGTCDHCGCHQAAAILPAILAASASIDEAVLAQHLDFALPELRSMELRPPIV